MTKKPVSCDSKEELWLDVIMHDGLIDSLGWYRRLEVSADALEKVSQIIDFYDVWLIINKQGRGDNKFLSECLWHIVVVCDISEHFVLIFITNMRWG